MEENPALELDEDKHEDGADELKDEFSENGEEEFEEKDGGEEEYDNIDVSEYVSEGDDEVATINFVMIIIPKKMRAVNCHLKLKPAFLICSSINWVY
jgi:hypothetical protein